jgi:hypothetical protein
MVLWNGEGRGGMIPFSSYLGVEHCAPPTLPSCLELSER